VPSASAIPVAVLEEREEATGAGVGLGLNGAPMGATVGTEEVVSREHSGGDAVESSVYSDVASMYREARGKEEGGEESGVSASLSVSSVAAPTPGGGGIRGGEGQSQRAPRKMDVSALYAKAAGAKGQEG
jgi:hypothetical protein